MQNKLRTGLVALFFLLVVMLVQATIVTIVTYDPTGLPSNNWTLGTNDTIPFKFYYVGNETQSNCTLYVDGTAMGTSSTVANNTNTTFYANNTLSEGAHEWNITCEYADGTNSSTIRNINIDNSDPSILITDSPADETTYLNQNMFNFSFNATDTYSTDLSCSLDLSEWSCTDIPQVGCVPDPPDFDNETNNSATTGAITTFADKTFNDGIYVWKIGCDDWAGNGGNTDIFNFTVDVTPDKPIIWPLSTSTDEENLTVIGYVNRTTTTVTVHATKGGSSNSDSTLTADDSTLNGTGVVGSVGNNSYFLLNRSAYPDLIGNVSYLEFAGHNRTYFLRYAATIDIHSANYFKVNFTPNLESNLTKGEVVYVYNNSRPSGWFNNTVRLFAGGNNINAEGSRLGSTGPSSDDFNVHYDTLTPTIDLSTVTNYSTNTPGIDFTVTDDYSLNISTVVVDLSGTLYTYSDTELLCSGSNASQTCTLSETLSDGYYNISVTVNDTYGQSNTSETKAFLVNGQAPTIALSEPIADDVEDLTNNVTFNFTVTDLFDVNTLNCSLYINGTVNQTNESVENSTITFFAVNDLTDDSYSWYVSCENNAGGSNQSETRTLTVANAPDAPVFETTPTVVRENSITIIGFVNKSDTTLNITFTQGNWFPNSTTAFTNTSSDFIGTATVGKQNMPAGSSSLYVETSAASSLANGYIEFANHNRANFERYQVTGVTVYDMTYSNVTISPSLNSTVTVGETIKAYNSSLPSGWFNLTLENLLLKGGNNITVFGERWGVTGPSAVIEIFYDNETPVIDTSNIPNVTITNSINLNFTITDNYEVNLNTILVEIYNKNTSELLTYNLSNSSVLFCSGNSSVYCDLTPTLSDANYSINISVRDTLEHYAETSVSNLLVKTIVLSVFRVDDGSVTISSRWIRVNWTNSSDDYLDYYELSLGTEAYNESGYNSVRDWFSVGANNSRNESWDITPGNAYYFNVRPVDIFGNVGNVTSSNGIIYEDNSPPALGNITIIGTGANIGYTQRTDELSANWNFTDPQTGISMYEYAIGTTTYPITGWDSIKIVTEWNYSSVTAANLTLQEDVPYYFSVRAKNGYQYGYGWSDWYYSPSDITVDSTPPAGGSIYYQAGISTGSSVSIAYSTGYDLVSGIYRAALMKATANMNATNGGRCEGYSNYDEVLNVTLLTNGTNATLNDVSLENGKCHRFAIYVWDYAGNKARYYLGNQIYNLSVDSTPPQSFTVADSGHITSSTTLVFSWESSNDPESGISYYQYRLEDQDGGPPIVDWTNNGLSTSVNDLQNLNLSDEDTYYLIVRAWNNINVQTNASSNGITYLDMSTPLPLTVISVGNDTNSADGWLDLSNSLNVTINLSGENNLPDCVWSYYDIAYTDENWLNYSWNCDNTANATGIYTCNAKNITEGIWTLHATCRDSAGNKQTQNENTDFTFIKENAPPQINITIPENNSIVNGVINASASIWDASSYNATYEVRKVDDDSLATSGAITDPSSISIDTTSFDGEYTLTVFAIDAYNHSSNESAVFIVDNNAPTVNIVLDESYYNADFNFTLSTTLFTNLTYNLTNSSGSLIRNQTWNYAVMQNSSTLNNVSVDVSSLTEGVYTIRALAIDNESNSRTDTETFTVDTTAPDNRGGIEVESSAPIYENETVTLYLNWRDLGAMDTIVVEHTANGSLVNYTATATTPGVQVYENYTRYKVDIPIYWTSTGELINYTWYATDEAGNQNTYLLTNVSVVNRLPTITTNNLTDAWQNVSYSTFVYFTDLDDTQSNSSYFNCSIDPTPAATGLNISIVDDTRCLLLWNKPVANNYVVNITVNDFDASGALLNSTISEINFTVQPTVIQNSTVNTSHTITFEYLENGEVMASQTASTDMNMTLATSNLFTLRLSVDNLVVTTSNFNATDNLDVFFQLLNNDTIDNNDTDLGPDRRYKPLEAYAFRINSTHNGTYTVTFNYSEYGVSNAANLEIFKFTYDEDSGEINYSDQQTVTTTVSTATLTIYTTVSNFSVFVLGYDTSGSSSTPPPPSPTQPGGSSRRSSSSTFYVPPATCDDNISNQGEIGVDCGGPCDPCKTCHDRIQNQRETGVDCGGPCLRCQAATCTDGILNDGEEGIDCGGPCLPCPGCSNNYWDEGEEGMDCGGVCSNECEVQIVETVVTEEKIIEKPIKKTPSYVWIVMIAIALFGGIAALWIYTKEEKVVEETTARAVAEEQEITELKDEERDIMGRYVYNYLAQGLKEAQIKTQLVVDGFKEYHVDTVMAAILRDQKILEVSDYLESYTKQGYTIDELKNWILDQGVDQDLLEEAIAKRDVSIQSEDKKFGS
ncbi:hypothetical protein HQ533_00715 [Candidatus Woesearchaeota archaeon]|nr:hypothetical protein [Candidatus Woesearchaeota archaeon]